MRELRSARFTIAPYMRRRPTNTPCLADTLRAASVLALWPKCFDASIEKYGSRDPTSSLPDRPLVHLPRACRRGMIRP